MPKAHPQLPLERPAPLTAEEERYILKTIRAYYGDDVVVRNWWPDPRHLMLHVESDRDIGLDRHECLGLLMCEIIRDQITLDASSPSGRWKRHKTAYRQGVILPTTTSD
jgi:hypothetical protein